MNFYKNIQQTATSLLDPIANSDSFPYHIASPCLPHSWSTALLESLEGANLKLLHPHQCDPDDILTPIQDHMDPPPTEGQLASLTKAGILHREDL